MAVPLLPPLHETFVFVVVAETDTTVKFAKLDVADPEELVATQRY